MVLNYLLIGIFQKYPYHFCSTSLYARQLQTISKMIFVQLDMFHSYTEIGGLVIELAFSMVLNYMLIGTSQKQPIRHRSSMRSHRYFGRGNLCSAIRSTVKLKLKELKQNLWFNGFELGEKLGIFRSSQFGAQSLSYQSASVRIDKKFIGRNLYIFKSPTVKSKLQKLQKIVLTVFLECAVKDKF